MAQSPQFSAGAPLTHLPCCSSPEGLQSYRASISREGVPVSCDEYFPVAAIVLCGVGSCGGVQVGGAAVQMNDLTSRAGFWLDKLFRPNGCGDTPPRIDIQIRAGINCTTELIFEGSMFPQTWDDRGLLLQIGGIMANQWEIWMRVPCRDQPCSVPIEVSLTITTDRIGDNPPDANGQLIPLLGKIMAPPV